MLSLNLKIIFAARGIENPYTYLVKAGFTRNAASRLLNNSNQSFPIKHIENLCLLLHCTPNDLLVWQPASNQSPLANNHPMHQLRPQPALQSVSELLKQMPLNDLKNLVTQLHTQKDNP